MAAPQSVPDVVVKIFRSSLLHFFLLGGVVFGLYALVTPPFLEDSRGDVLRLSEAEADRLEDAFKAAWGRTPTEDEAHSLVRDWAIEEAMVREALELGLDQGDAMIRIRLRAKMEFIAEAPASAIQPDEETLRKFYAENTDAYGRPAKISFSHLLLPSDASQDEVTALMSELELGAEPASLGAATMLPGQIDGMATPAVERVFGGGFGEAVAVLPVSVWSGTVKSGYGLHLVRLEAKQEAVLPPLDDVRDKVLADWRSAEARKMREAFTEHLLSRYTLELPASLSSAQP